MNDDEKKKYGRNLKNRIILELFGQVSNIASEEINSFEKSRKLKNELSAYPYDQCFEGFEYRKLPLVWRMFYKLIEQRKTYVLMNGMNLARSIKR